MSSTIEVLRKGKQKTRKKHSPQLDRDSRRQAAYDDDNDDDDSSYDDKNLWKPLIEQQKLEKVADRLEYAAPKLRRSKRKKKHTSR
jgi:hypothetical protein